MRDQQLDRFQTQVAELLLRHRSVLDVLSKLQETSARTNRSITKAVTNCGCLKVQAGKQPFTSASNFDTAKDAVDTHLSGDLCEHCRDVVVSEMGKHLFYLASACNLLDIHMRDVIEKESEKLSTLGLFNMS